MAMRLRELREKRNLKQKDIAKILGVDRTTYAKYESGASEPKKDVFITLSNVYGVSVGYLLGQEDGEKKPTPVSGDGQIGPSKKMLLDMLDGMSEDEAFIVAEMIKAMRKKRQ